MEVQTTTVVQLVEQVYDCGMGEDGAAACTLSDWFASLRVLFDRRGVVHTNEMKICAIVFLDKQMCTLGSAFCMYI